MIREGLTRTFGAGEAIETPYGPITLWPEGESAHSGLTPAEGEAVPEAPPAWLRAPVAPEVEAAPPLTPSGALRAADGQRIPERREADAEARRRGVLIHSLLEHLPRLDPARREAAATGYVRARAPALPEPKRAGIVRAALRLLDEPDLAPLFARAARAEVTLSGRVQVGGAERPVFGRVDRLAVTDDTVLIADFKTGRPPQDDAPLPEAASSQIALYATLLARIYPGRRVVPMLVWTSGPVIRRLGDAEIAVALAGLN
jgi:ATP-dependent helicase/nuclease subunit A